jgi:glycine/D-amino acid oxidase-like deaminating enzyme
MVGAEHGDGDGIALEPLWTAEAPLDDGEPAPLPEQADVVVVGAGYAGLMAGHEVASRGRHAVVLDAGPLGWGASSRNGGMVIPELKSGPTAMAEKHGDLGRRLYAAVDEAFDLVEQLCGPGGIDADYARTGQLLLAHHPRAIHELKALEADLAEAGDPVRFVSRDQLHEEVASDEFSAGLVIERTGGLHPARFHRGLLERTRAAGAELHGRTRATAITRRPAGGFAVTTDRGEIQAGEVLVLTNAYADGLLPELARRVLPIGSFIIATEPLDPALADALIPHRRMLVDTKQLLLYWRLAPGRRLVFGGRRSLAPTSVPDAAEFLHRELLRVHPQLRDVAITHAWGGEVAMTLDRLPHAGVIDGVRYAAGCNGSGVALNTWLGRAVGAWACGDQAPPFAELSHRPIPLGRLRRAWLPVVGELTRARDRLGR